MMGPNQRIMGRDYWSLGIIKEVAWEVQPKKRGGCCSIGQDTPLSTVDDTVVKKRSNFQEYHVWHLLASLFCKKSLDMLV